MFENNDQDFMDKLTTKQDEEIKTIRKRTIQLELSDADVERLCEQAGKAGLTVPGLLENFIGDLVYGTHTNGSDECSLANDWFNRCWFGSYNDYTLLRYLIENGEAWHFLDRYKELQDFKNYPERYEKPEGDDPEDIECWKNDIADLKYWEEQNNEIIEEYKKEHKVKDFCFEEEIQKIIDYSEEYFNLQFTK